MAQKTLKMFQEDAAATEAAAGGEWIDYSSGRDYEYSRAKIDIPDFLLSLLWCKRRSDNTQFSIFDVVTVHDGKPGAGDQHIICAILVENYHVRNKKVKLRLLNTRTRKAHDAAPSHLLASLGPCNDAALLAAADVEAGEWQAEREQVMAEAKQKMLELQTAIAEADAHATPSGSASGSTPSTGRAAKERPRKASKRGRPPNLGSPEQAAKHKRRDHAGAGALSEPTSPEANSQTDREDTEMTAEDEEETRQQKAEEPDEEPDRGVNPAAISAAVASALAPALSPLVSMLSQMQQQQAHLAKTLERKSGSGAALSGAESRPASSSSSSGRRRGSRSSSSSSEADSRPDDDDSASAMVPYAQPQTAAQFGVAMPGSFSLPPAAVSNSDTPLRAVELQRDLAQAQVQLLSSHLVQQQVQTLQNLANRVGVLGATSAPTVPPFSVAPYAAAMPLSAPTHTQPRAASTRRKRRR